MSDFKDLFDRYLADKLTPQEAQQFLDDIGNENMPGYLDELLREKTFRGTPDPDREERIFQRIMEKGKVRTINKTWWWAAAAAVLIVCVSTWGIKHKEEHFIVDAKPGKQGAILTLSDGKQVTLDSLHNGTVTTQNGSRLLLNNGQLTYNKDSATSSIAYNTLTTTRGRQFQLVLPDGTKVWLNAASSIRYPTAFTGNERTVNITGEAYFEVAANAAKPFKVKLSNETTIDVLGTHFNINAYADENRIQTTLTEGAIKVRSGSLSAVLSPGQQAVITTNIRIITDANTDQAIAWKEGLFNFQGMPFDEAMRQLARWYNIDVVYENGIPDIKFEGELGRDVSLSKILFFLSKVDVHYRIEDGKRLVISK
jgi:transmembrane sensor